jgi:MIP family channel proteins
MEKNLSRDAFAEGIGTFMLILIGAGTGALVQQADNAKLLLVALAHGLALVGIIYTYGHVSGAHVNPAVTMGLLVGGHIRIQRAIFYWIAQFIGAALAAGFLKLFILTTPALNITGLGETTGTLTPTLPNALAVEFILTFILVSVVTHAAAFGKAGQVAGLGIALTLAGCIIFGGNLTGASLNPARTFGPALVQGTLFTQGSGLSYAIPYIIAILLGGATAGYIQNAFFAAPPQPPVSDPKRKR